jgi:hypothetical protein
MPLIVASWLQFPEMGCLSSREARLVTVDDRTLGLLNALEEAYRDQEIRFLIELSQCTTVPKGYPRRDPLVLGR